MLKKSRKLAALSLCFGLGSSVVLTDLIVLPAHAGRKIPVVYGRPDYVPRAVDLETFNTYSRFSVAIDSTVEARMTETAAGFELLLPKLMLVDIGAPLGKEGEWVREFEKLNDSRLQKLKISQTEAGVKITGTWAFASGDQAPANRKMDHFEYRIPAPARFVVDFWPKPGPTVGEVRAQQEKERRLRVAQEKQARELKMAERQLASVKRLNDAGDLERYCREPYQEQNDVFLRFRPHHKRFDLTKYLSLVTADQEYRYFEPQGDSREEQLVRLASKLYAQGKLGLAIRTVDFLKEEFGKSRFLSEMLFLRANAMIKLGLHDQAKQLLEQIVFEAKGSPVAMHAAFYLAAKQYLEGHTIASLERFLWLIKYYPNYRLAWVFHFAAAECLYDLRQTVKAEEEYQWLAVKAPERQIQAEASFRMGDLFLERGQYEQALAAYYKSIKFFTPESEQYAAVHINRAESLYWLREFDRAAEEFQSFLKNFGSHPAGWRATYRLAEIAGRQNSKEKSREWLYKTVNDFPFSPAATLARLRLVSCDDHGGFTSASAKKFFEQEASKYNATDEVLLVNYYDFYVLSRARSSVALDSPDEALKVTADLLTTKTSEYVRAAVSELFLKMLRKGVKEYLAHNKGYEALSLYSRFSKVFVKADDYIWFDYLLELARAASDLKLGNVAVGIVADYRKKVQLSSAVSQRDPASAEITSDQDELLKSEVSFSEAEAIWVQAGLAQEVKIRDLLDEVEDSSAFSHEKELLLSVIEKKKGNLPKALQHALNADILRDKVSARQPAAAVPVKIPDGPELNYWIGSLQKDSGRLQEALDSLDKVNEALKSKQHLAPSQYATLGLPAVPKENDIILSKAEIYEKQSRWGEAAAQYALIAKKTEAPINIQYAYARSLNRMNQPESQAEARKIFKKIVESPEKSDAKDTQFWKKLAQEALQETD